MEYFRYFSRGFRDLFTRRVLLVALFPLALVLLLFAVEAAASFLWLIPWLRRLLPFLEGQVVTVLTDVLLTLLLLGFFALVNILLAVTLIGVFFTEQLVDQVNRTYYRKRLTPFGTVAQIVSFSLQAFFRFLGLFVLLSPLYLVPGLNLLAFALPSFLYFKRTVLFDVASQTVGRAMYETVLSRWPKTLTLLFVPLYLLSYLPVVGLFSYIYAFLVVSHLFLDQQTALD